MSMIYITYDLVNRLLKSDDVGALDRLRTEIKDLLELGAAPWLPDELTTGADAVAYLLENASESGRQKLLIVLQEIIGSWNKSHTWSDKMTRGSLGIVGFIPKLSSNFLSQYDSFTRTLLVSLDRFVPSERTLEISGCPLSLLSHGFVTLFNACDVAIAGERLTGLIGAFVKLNSKLSIECGLHTLYALCARNVPFHLSQAALSRVLTPWMVTIAYNGYDNNLLTDKAIRQIQRHHKVAGKRLHHLLYRAWIMYVPSLMADRISGDALAWVADRADAICGVEPAQGAFQSANAMIDLMLRRLPRHSVDLVVREQIREFDGQLNNEIREIKTSLSYQATKIICLNITTDWSTDYLKSADSEAEKAARIAPDIAEAQFGKVA